MGTPGTFFPDRLVKSTNTSTNTASGTKKRSGIPIAPSGTESAARRDDAKRPPPSPMRWDCCGRGERFPRKDPGVFDLLGSLLSCDETGLGPPNKHLCLRDTELCIAGAQTKRKTRQGSTVTPHRGVVFFHPWVWSDFHNCSAASFLRCRRSLSSGGPSGICRTRSMKTFGSLTHAES